MRVNVLGYGTPSGSTARYLYGTVIDCRGSRLAAAFFGLAPDTHRVRLYSRFNLET